MKWLFVTTEFPWPIIHGRWLRVYHLCRALAGLGEKVGVISYGANEAGREAYEGVGVDVVSGPSGQRVTAGPGRCRLAPYAFDAAMAEAVQREAGSWDVVVLAGQTVLQYAPEARPAGLVVAEMVDDPCLEIRRRLWKNLRPGTFLRRVQKLIGQPRYEKAFIEHVEFATFVSEQDCESFRGRNRGADVRFLPNGVDVQYFRRPDDRPEPTGPPRIVFTGHMSHLPNQDAAEFLVRQIAPRVWEEVPDALVQLVGADPSPDVEALAGDRVEVTGKVPDLRPYLWDATVVAVPMRIGTGIKNKLLEAWAAGGAVVTTSMACQGVAARAGENLLIGDRPSDLADSMIRVIEDKQLRASLRAAANETAKSLGWETIARRLRDACQEYGVEAADVGSGGGG